MQYAFELHSHGALAATGQSRKPDCGTAVPKQFLAVFPGDIAFVPVHIRGFLFGHDSYLIQW